MLRLDAPAVDRYCSEWSGAGMITRAGISNLRAGSRTNAEIIDVISPVTAYHPKERSARLAACRSELYPMIEVQEQSATAGPTSIIDASTLPPRSRTRATTFAP